jgi:D-alanyl-D-alanine dipeptidase
VNFARKGPGIFSIGDLKYDQSRLANRRKIKQARTRRRLLINDIMDLSGFSKKKFNWWRRIG